MVCFSMTLAIVALIRSRRTRMSRFSVDARVPPQRLERTEAGRDFEIATEVSMLPRPAPLPVAVLFF